MGLLHRIKGIFRRGDTSAGEGETQDLPRRLESMEETLRRIRNYERRQGQVLDSLQHELSVKLDAALKDKEDSLPMEKIRDFASGFALYYLQHSSGEDRSLEHVWQSFQTMLQAVGMELILDQHAAFDSERHNSCDVRSLPEHPDGVVLEVIRPGFLVNGRVTRPADVVVNKRPSGA